MTTHAIRPAERSTSEATRRYDTIVIGGGQAGLVTGRYLKQSGHDFTILDASARIGDVWRNRWDSLRLFTPARYCALDGMPFPAPRQAFPTKDEMADYLEAYAAHFALPVQSGVRVDRVSRQGDHFVVDAGDRHLTAKQVVVAMGNYQKPHVPAFAQELDPGIVQFHSSAYQNKDQLQPGGVLVVGAANSGAEIAMETVRTHPTWLSGRHPGHVPFRIEGLAGRFVLADLVVGLLFHHVLTIKTPIGRRLRAAQDGHQAMPLVRTKPMDLAAAGVQRTQRVAGVRDGLPLLEDGRLLNVANVIWCTGYRPGSSWIDLPGLQGDEPIHERGVALDEPGLYFVGMNFQYAVSSGQIRGVSRDARYVAQAIEARQRETRQSAARQQVSASASTG